MSVTILIPTALRSFVDRKSEVEVEGSTIGEALANLAGQYPDLKHQIYEDDVKLRGFVNVFVDGTNIKKLNGLETKVAQGATVMLVPAIAGGC
ncbi:MAG: MoaD/ThiS family protein [Victivallales bacterium]|jgi:adenylyltransferase/sulfurtransferase|nr:MoaD/ThiS family protein [Victivallales bacterium]